jgi:hypothetical protein
VSAERRARVALVDLQLGDLDDLVTRLGQELEVTLVVAPAEDSPLARWAELGGYPWATDLEALTAVVADAVAVGEHSPRRGDALALAGALGARGTVLGPAPPVPVPGDPGARLDDELNRLFAEPQAADPGTRLWGPARDGGFSAGALVAPGEVAAAQAVVAHFGPPEALDWLLPLARHARGGRGWAQLALAEGGLWRAACALAPEGERGLAVALSGRLLPASGYGPPSGGGPEAARDRRLCEAILRAGRAGS